MHICPAYTHIWRYIPLRTARAAYIFIQRETLKHHTQATGATGSCSQHIIIIQQSPPEATEGFISRNISKAQAQSTHSSTTNCY